MLGPLFSEIEISLKNHRTYDSLTEKNLLDHSVPVVDSFTAYGSNFNTFQTTAHTRKQAKK